MVALIALSVGSRRQMLSAARPHAEATAGNHCSGLAPARCVTAGGAANRLRCDDPENNQAHTEFHEVHTEFHRVNIFNRLHPMHRFASHRARGKHTASDSTRLRSVKLRANFVKLRVRLIVFALTARMNQHDPRRLNSATPTSNAIRAMGIDVGLDFGAVPGAGAGATSAFSTEIAGPDEITENPRLRRRRVPDRRKAAHQAPRRRAKPPPPARWAPRQTLRSHQSRRSLCKRPKPKPKTGPCKGAQTPSRL
jgi:hypothetical protein